MWPQTLNAMHENLYNAVLIMIQYILLIIVGSASLLFIVICLVGAISDCVEEMTRPARRLLKPAPAQMEAPELDARDVVAALADLDKGLDYGLTGSPANREIASTQRA